MLQKIYICINACTYFLVLLCTRQETKKKRYALGAHVHYPFAENSNVKIVKQIKTLLIVPPPGSFDCYNTITGSSISAPVQTHTQTHTHTHGRDLSTDHFFSTLICFSFSSSAVIQPLHLSQRKERLSFYPGKDSWMIRKGDGLLCRRARLLVLILYVCNALPYAILQRIFSGRKDDTVVLCTLRPVYSSFAKSKSLRNYSWNPKVTLRLGGWF